MFGAVVTSQLPSDFDKLSKKEKVKAKNRASFTR